VALAVGFAGVPTGGVVRATARRMADPVPPRGRAFAELAALKPVAPMPGGGSSSASVRVDTLTGWAGMSPKRERPSRRPVDRPASNEVAPLSAAASKRLSSSTVWAGRTEGHTPNSMPAPIIAARKGAARRRRVVLVVAVRSALIG